MKNSLRASVLVLLAAYLTVASTATAQLARLIWGGDQLPVGTDSYFSFEPPRISDDGAVVFESRTSAAGLNYGLYMVREGEVLQMVRVLHTTPDFNGYFSDFYGNSFSLSVADGGRAVFAAALTGSLGGTTDDSGIYLFGPGGLTQVAREGQTVAALDGKFSDLKGTILRMNNNGQIAGYASIISNNVSRDVIFVYSGGSYARMVNSGQTMPDNNGYIFGLFPPNLNEDGQVAFTAWVLGSTNSSDRAICRADGTGVRILARLRQTSPDGNGYFSSFFNGNYVLPAAFNDQGKVAFHALLGGTSGGAADNAGIFLADGNGVTQLVRKGEFVPGGNGRYLEFSTVVSINQVGQVAFAANLTGTTGGAADSARMFLVTGGSIKEVARKGQPAPGGNGVIAGIGAPTLNDSGEILFSVTLSGTAGGTGDDVALLLVDASGAIHLVAREGQSVGGRNITSFPSNAYLVGFSSGGSSALNNNGEVTFYSYASGGGSGTGVFLWSRSHIAPIEIIGNQINIPFTMVADTTNYVQASSSITAGGIVFEDISGPITRNGRRGRISTNFVDSISFMTNSVRLYRVRTSR